MSEEQKPPEKPFSPTSELYQKVDQALDRVRPYLQRDGGEVELVDVDEQKGIVFVRLQGSCRGCPSSAMTLHMGIESELRNSIPQIKQVVAV